MENVYHSHEKQNGWHKKNRFIHQNVLPHTNWQNVTKSCRTNSRTNCQQNRIAISRQYNDSLGMDKATLAQKRREDEDKGAGEVGAIIRQCQPGLGDDTVEGNVRCRRIQGDTIAK